jgi:archaellum component FlaF (FlaF/FlaG flagellin family)
MDPQFYYVSVPFLWSWIASDPDLISAHYMPMYHTVFHYYGKLFHANQKFNKEILNKKNYHKNPLSIFSTSSSELPIFLFYPHSISASRYHWTLHICSFLISEHQNRKRLFGTFPNYHIRIKTTWLWYNLWNMHYHLHKLVSSSNLHVKMALCTTYNFFPSHPRVWTLSL